MRAIPCKRDSTKQPSRSLEAPGRLDHGMMPIRRTSRVLALPDRRRWTQYAQQCAAGARPGTRARAPRLLKAFSDARPEWRLSELARAAHLHKATAHRLLAALEREGMLARDAAGDLYRLGPEAIALGARAARANHLRAVSRAELEALAAATGETATLEVLVDGDMLILDEVLGRGLIGATASLGTRWPAHAA